MNAGFDHKLLSSFYLWCDDRLSYFAQAYQPSINHTFVYVDTVDTPLNYNAFYSPYRQFMWSSDKIAIPDEVVGHVKIIHFSKDKHIVQIKC